LKHVALVKKHFNIIIKDKRVVFDGTNFIVLVVTFMHGIYNYIHEKGHVSWVDNVADILFLQYMVHTLNAPLMIVLCFYNLSNVL
jgi:hypothetical protein